MRKPIEILKDGLASLVVLLVYAGLAAMGITALLYYPVPTLLVAGLLAALGLVSWSFERLRR